ncbi:MAG: glycosyltransferase family 2 protein [Desulfamplus sp.]|nr:glycosyltransferase family 2 protein [Desulfamplus sp.]
MKIPFISVIVPTYNDSLRLSYCLNALRSQTYPKSRYEIIVVDNNSTEDIRSIANQNDCIYTFENHGHEDVKIKGYFVLLENRTTHFL